MRLLAIDPGSELSGWVEYDLDDRLPVAFGKWDNHVLKDRVEESASRDDVMGLAVEMIVSYGKSVGNTVFATCVWIGRFVEAWESVGAHRDEPVMLVSRQQVKRKLMGGNMRATDAQVRARLVKLYGPSEREAVGLKASPGPLFGVAGDVWQALALAVVAAG